MPKLWCLQRQMLEKRQADDANTQNGVKNKQNNHRFNAVHHLSPTVAGSLENDCPGLYRLMLSTTIGLDI